MKRSLKPSMHGWVALRTLSILSSASFVAVVFSIATNKIIAVSAGTEGVALMGLYRNFGAWITGVLTFGFEMVLLQRISSAPAGERFDSEYSAAAILFTVQFACLALLWTGFSGSLAAVMFGLAPLESHLWEYRLVIGMGFVNLAVQTLSALLKGHGLVGGLAKVQILMAAASLFLIVPLLRLGRSGLALNVGSGALFGCLAAAYFLWDFHRESQLRLSWRKGWAVLWQSAKPSALVCVDSFVLLGAAASVQSQLARHYGLETLGNYNAALLIINTLVTVLMSAARTYLLPLVGKQRGRGEPASAFALVMMMTMVANAFIGVACIFFSSALIHTLFSSSFASAPTIVAVLCLSLPGQVLGWNFNTLLLSRGEFGLCFALNSAWAVTLVSGTAICTAASLPIISMAWVLVISYSVYGVNYAMVSAWKLGERLLSPDDIRGLAVSAALLPLALYAAAAFSDGNQAAAAAAGVAIIALTVKLTRAALHQSA